MSLTLRNVVNRPITWTEGDANFLYLLTNMSGSTINITGSNVNVLSNHINAQGNLVVTGSLTVNTTTYNSKRYIATIDQSDTSIPSVNRLVKNDFTSSISFARTDSGKYTIQCSDFGIATYVVGKISFSDFPDDRAYRVYYDNTVEANTYQRFYSYQDQSAYSDGIIQACLLEVEAFY